MSEAPDQQSESAAPARSDGCVVLLVDESRALESRMAEGAKSKSATIATALNRLLGWLGEGPPLDVALVGYRCRSDGTAVVGPRWAGVLEGRQFVSTSELAAAPVNVEQRVRNVPDPGAYGAVRQETISFPIWYAPVLGDSAPKAAAMGACRDMLAQWLDGTGPVAKPPLVISLLGDIAAEDSVAAAVEPLLQLQTPAGVPVVLHAHLGGPVRGMPTLYPSSDVHLTAGPVADLFAASSVIPELLAAALREAQVSVIRDARGLIHNAGMGDLIRLLGLARTYAAYRPPAPSPAPPSRPEVPVPETIAEAPPSAPRPADPVSAEAEAPQAMAPEPVSAANAESLPPGANTAQGTVLLVLLLDRSAEPERGDGQQNVWTRIERHANEILGSLARRGQGRFEVALVCYGDDEGDGSDVQVGFAGTLAGPTVVADSELAAGALRVEEFQEQVSNGIGGLVTVTRRRMIFVDLEPTAAGSPRAGLEEVAGLLADWHAENPQAAIGPIVLHASRGRYPPETLVAGADRLRPADHQGPAPSLYHLVVTESPHGVLAYPADTSRIEDATLEAMFQTSSPLMGREHLAVRRPSLSADCRGLVVNAGFDLLLEGIEAALAGRKI